MARSTKESFEVEQLRDEIEALKRAHKRNLDEKDDLIKELRAQLRVKRRTEDVVHAEITYNYFPAIMLKIATVIDPSKRLANFYIKFMSVINYCFVCGVIGHLINQVAVHVFYRYVPLYLAVFFAMFVTVIWNWNNTVGPFGYFFGLSPKRMRGTKK